MVGNKLALITLLVFGMLTSAIAEESSAPQDEILLKNGSRIFGTVTTSRDGVVTVETDFAGTLSINTEEIQSMRTQGDLVVQMADGRIFKDRPITMEEDLFVVTEGNGDQLSYAVTDILLVNPEPWELGDGYKASGLVSFAWALERGNSDTDELDYNLESIWRSLEDRYTVRFNGEIDEANDAEIADNWKVVGKYDYFLEDRWYTGANISAEQDQFADLDLRYYAGAYVGRHFYTESIFSLEAELGLAYVNEDFSTAPDQDYPGANWSLRIASDYLGGGSKLYMNHDAIWNLDTTEDIILNTAFGLSFPLLGNLEAAAEVLYEYDSGAVEDIETLDETYNFRIGYTW
ncbi:MAG: DUF481 domain-containing protein [Gammaproteobacteria bacterium]|nr:MAG: DUF481 domain-containing protein [Gammaproteobacteria bacterium]